MSGLVYADICAGISAATLAWKPLGWRCAFYSEIEKFPSAILKHRYPDTPNRGDMTAYESWPDADLDVLIGGTPCQGFSIAGKRKGLDDPRSNLALCFGSIAERFKPRWLLWENVPGARSQNKGRDLGAFFGGLVELGYGVCYRSFDAQFAGLAQRRERLFAVGYLGDWRPAAAVLFEPEGLRWDSAPRREARQRVAHTVAGGARGGGGYSHDDIPLAFGGNNTSGPVDLATACQAHGGPHGRLDFASETFIAGTLNANGKAAGSATQQDAESGLLIPIAEIGASFRGRETKNHGSGIANAGDPMFALSATKQHAIAFSQKDHGADAGDPAPTLRAMGHDGSHANAGGQVAVAFGWNKSASQEMRVSDTTGPLQGSPTSNPAVAQPFTLASRGRDGGHNLEYRQDGTANAVLTPSGGRGGIGVGAVANGWAVRRLTPRECERLMGVPDDYTRIPWRGKPAELCPDGPRYKALGNSIAVPDLRWIGERIEICEDAMLELRSKAA